MSEVVVNSTPIIILSRIDRAYLLEELFGNIVIPKAVLREVTSKDDGAARLLLGRPGWIRIEEVPGSEETSLMSSRLHAGEVEVILLAKRLRAKAVVLDDLAARRTAEFLGLNVTGTLGVLILAKRSGIIGEVATAIADLEASGFRLDDAIVEKALSLAGER